jgi:hypothetical protein
MDGSTDYVYLEVKVQVVGGYLYRCGTLQQAILLKWRTG